MPNVIAIAGRIGSGKTTLSKDVAAALACPRATFGDYVRRRVLDRGLLPSRENLQVIGTELLLDNATEFCRSVISMSGWQKELDLVIDGLRHLITIPIIRRITQPATLRIVYVSVPEDIRLNRLSDRGEGGQENVARIESHSSEQELESLAEMADIEIKGDGDRSKNVSIIRARLRNQQC